MKIFISNSILQFKTRFIPKDVIILPMTSILTGGLNTTIINLKLLKPTEIICETDEILKIIFPYFKEIPISVINYSDGVEYCGSLIKNKMNYAVISAYFLLFLYGIILDNFIVSIFLIIINLTVFFAVIIWFSDREEWESGSKRIIHS
jgi:hypothetical protein